MSQRAFVAGATGHTGRAVVHHLRQRGVDTVAHVRPDSSRLEHWRQHFEAEGAQVDDTPWEAAAMQSRLLELAPTQVFALLGTTKKRERGDAGSTYEAVDYGLTVLLAEAAAKLNPKPRFIYLSSLGVREGTRNAYMSARARSEARIRQLRLPFTFARPSFISGDRQEDRPLERFGARASDGLLSLAAAVGARSLKRRYASTTGDALAGALVRLAFDPGAENAVVEAEGLRQ